MKQVFTIIALIVILCAFNGPVCALPHPNSVQQQADAETLFRTAYSLYREGKYDEALAKCTEAVTLNPNDYRARALRGYIYIAQKKWKDASDAFAEAIRLQPGVKEIYLAKAEVDRFRNANDEAIAGARKATELDPNYAAAFAMLGDLLANRKEKKPRLSKFYELPSSLIHAYPSHTKLSVACIDLKRTTKRRRRFSDKAWLQIPNTWLADLIWEE